MCATRSWRHEPLGTQGMRVRTPSGGIARPGAMSHTRGRSCFPAFPFAKPGGPVPDPAARAGLSTALPTAGHEGCWLVGVTSPSSSSTAERTGAATLVHWKSTAIGSPSSCRWLACPVRVMAWRRGALALRRLIPGRSVSSAPMALPHCGVATARPPPPPSAGVRSYEG